MKKISKNESYQESFKYAFEGLVTAFKEERNIRTHFVLAVVVILFSWFIGLSQAEWLWILFAIFMVVFAELNNTIVENVVDLITRDYHDLAKKAKDISAACVLFTSFFALIIALIIFIPKIVSLI